MMCSIKLNFKTLVLAVALSLIFGCSKKGGNPTPPRPQVPSSSATSTEISTSSTPESQPQNSPLRSNDSGSDGQNTASGGHPAVAPSGASSNRSMSETETARKMILTDEQTRRNLVNAPAPTGGGATAVGSRPIQPPKH